MQESTYITLHAFSLRNGCLKYLQSKGCISNETVIPIVRFEANTKNMTNGGILWFCLNGCKAGGLE